MTAKIFRFVRHARVHQYLELGWIAHDSLDDTHHGRWSKLLEWPFPDKHPEEPKEMPLAG